MTGYLISTVPTSPTVTVPAAATSGSLTGVRPGITYQVGVSAIRGAVQGSIVGAAGTVRTAAPGGSFTPLSPVRLLDTRTGFGSPKGATQSVTLQITGRGGVPTSAVSAVALNLTVTQPKGSGYVSAYPTGGNRPVVSNINYTAKQTVANLVIVPVGAGGKVTLYSYRPAQLVADVSGYFTTALTASPASGLFQPLSPSRLMDTRNGLGASTPGAGRQVKIKVTGNGGVPASNVSAVVLNTTVAGSTAAGYLTAYPTGGTRPLASTINFTPKQVVANRTVVPVGTDGSVNFYNSSGKTPIVVDVAGWFTAGSDPSASGSYFVATTPTRVVDTRRGLGAPKGAVKASAILAAGLAGGNGLPAVTAPMPPTAVVATVTFVGPSSGTYGTVYPSLTSRPLASDLNARAGATVPNLTLPGLGADGKVAVYNNAGATQVIVDLSGYFVGEIHVPTSTVVMKQGTVKEVSGDPANSATVTLATGTPTPAVGQILTSTVTAQTPNGLLVKVVGVTIDSQGQSVAQTEPATLQEAIGSGELSVSVPLSGSDVVAAQGAGIAPGRAKVLSADDVGRRQANPAGVTPVTGTKSKSACSGDADSFVETEFSIEPTLNLQIRLGWSGFHPTVKAEAYAQIKQTAGVGFGFGGKVSCDWQKDLAKFTFPTVTFTVGAVPVVIIPQLTVKLKAAISGQAEISSSVRQEFTARAGLSYDGSKVTPINEISNTLSFQPLALTKAQGSASVALVAELIGKLYGIAGPTITVTAKLTATLDPPANPWWILLFALTAKAGLNLEVSIIKVSVQTDEFALYRKVLAQSGGNPNPATPIRLTFNNYSLGTRISTQYQSSGIVFGGETIPYITSDNANPTSPVLSGGSGFGSTLYGNLVNPDGSDRTVSSLVLDVGYIDNPGSTEVLAYDSNGRLLQTAVANAFGIVTITIRRAGIHSFLVRSTGVESSGWAIDNVSFLGFAAGAGAGAAAPAPDTLLPAQDPAPAGGSTRGSR